eukprot:8118179-Heterocapsa_arctica.AAC.1
MATIAAVKLWLSHNGVIACEEAIPTHCIDCIYICDRTLASTRWLLYDHKLDTQTVFGIGEANWRPRGGATFGSSQRLRPVDVAPDFREEVRLNWSCATRACPSNACEAFIPA